MLAPGHVIDQRYRVVASVGCGGMAEVFRATDTVTAGAVALKVLRGHEPGQAERFRAEADALARLDHPGVVQLRGAGTHDGAPYLVLDLADGPSLADRLAAGPLGLDRAVALGTQVADALSHAHRLGVVHRDVKPSNILGAGHDRWRLADFGIAGVAGEPSLTTTGLVVGSPPYVAPEQVEGRPVGPAADVYALALVVIECLTGHRCYRGGQFEVALARLHRQPAIPTGLPEWLRDVLAAMTARDPLRRPSTAAVADAFRDRTAEPVVAVTAEVPTVVYLPVGAPVDARAGGAAPPRPRGAAPGRRPHPRRARPLAHGRRPPPRRAGALAAVGTAAALVLSFGLWAAGGEADPAPTRGEPARLATTQAIAAGPGGPDAGGQATTTTGALADPPPPDGAAEPAPARAAAVETQRDDGRGGIGGAAVPAPAPAAPVETGRGNGGDGNDRVADAGGRASADAGRPSNGNGGAANANGRASADAGPPSDGNRSNGNGSKGNGGNGNGNRGNGRG
ncbi:MAG TPA: serine/threonine-protein kinase [Acidimicrobiales bacterium]